MSEVSHTDHEGYSYHENLEKLIIELERLACREDEDFASGLKDDYRKSEPALDVGGELSSEVFFVAERTRSSHISPTFGEVYGDVISTSYQIGGSVASAKPRFDSFPAEIQEYLLGAVEVDLDDENDSNPWHETLHDKDTAIVVEYRYSHTIFQDGTVTPHSELVILIDEDEFPVPETAAAYTSKPAKDVEQNPGRVDMTEFEKLFDSESLLALGSLQQQLVTRHEQVQILTMFYDQIESIRFMTQDARLHAVRTTINYLYEPKAA